METNLEDLVAMALFAKVVEHRSFTAAAAKVGLSKSAVSARIAALEARFGVRLLQRTTRRLTLTEDGVQFYEHCSSIVRAADEAQLQLTDSVREIRGALRVTAPPAFCRVFLADAIADFMRRHPQVEIFLHADEKFMDLLEGDLDLAIRFARKLDNTLIARRLLAEPAVLCASPAYLERAGTPQVPEDLREHEFVRFAYTSVRDELVFHGPDGTYAIPIRGRFISNDGDVLRRMVLLGMGITMLPMHIVAQEIAEGRLVRVLEPYYRDELGVYAVYLHRKVPRRLRAFVDFLVERFRFTTLG